MMRMTLSLEAKILMAFIAWGLVLLGAGWFAVSSGRAYLASDARVDRLHETERALMALQISLRSAESGQRGFLITGRPEYLRPYVIARGDIDRELDQTLGLIADQAEALSHVPGNQWQCSPPTCPASRGGRGARERWLWRRPPYRRNRC